MAQATNWDKTLLCFFTFFLTTHLDPHKPFFWFAGLCSSPSRPFLSPFFFAVNLPLFSYLQTSVSNLLFSLFHSFRFVLALHPSLPSLHIHISPMLSHLTIIVPCSLLIRAHFVPSLVFFFHFLFIFFNMQTFQPVPLQPFTLDDLFLFK